VGFLKVRKPGTALVALALAVLFAACQAGPPAPAGELGLAGGEGPQRIIALAPNVTEILFALGLADRVAGVGDYAAWPPEVADKPRLGGLFDVRLEAIAKLHPDLAVLIPSERSLGRQLEALGVEVMEVRSESLGDVAGAITSIAARCGVAQVGESLLAQWRAGLDLEPLEGKPRVMLTVGRQPGRIAGVLVAGPGTYLDEMLHKLGGINVFADADSLYPEIGLEEVLRRAPDVIVELQTTLRNPQALLADWESLPGVPAADSGCLQWIAGEHVMIPGPRLPKLQREMRDALASCRRVP